MSSVTFMWRSENVLSNNATGFVFAHEIISLKISKTQNFRKTRHFLNRAVINGLIYRTLPRLMVKINPPLAVMINHPLTVSVLPNPFHTTASQLYYSRNCVAQFHDIKAYFFNLAYHTSISILGATFVLFVRGDGSKIFCNQVEPCWLQCYKRQNYFTFKGFCKRFVCSNFYYDF